MDRTFPGFDEGLAFAPAGRLVLPKAFAALALLGEASRGEATRNDLDGGE